MAFAAFRRLKWKGRSLSVLNDSTPTTTAYFASLLRKLSKWSSLYPASEAVKKAREEGGAIAVIGNHWGGEFRIPMRVNEQYYYVDWILALLDKKGNLKQFTAVEVQTVDTTSSYHDSFIQLLNDRKVVKSGFGLNWENVCKRTFSQLIYKGQILQDEIGFTSGIWLVTPEMVYLKFIKRLGGESNLNLNLPSQQSSIHFLRYDYDIEAPKKSGEPIPLKIVGESCTTVDKVRTAYAFINTAFDSGACVDELKKTLYGDYASQ